MHSWNWISLLISVPLAANGLFFTNGFLQIQPNRDTYVVVNDTILLSCKNKQSVELSMFLNDTLIKKENTSYMEYNLTSHKPEMYKYMCKYNSMKNYAMISFKYLSKVISAKTVITSLGLCHAVVNFTFVHLNKADYIKIQSYANDKLSTYQSPNLEFTCMLGASYNFTIQVSSIDLPVYTKTWIIKASTRFYKFAKLTELVIRAKSSENLSLFYEKLNKYDKIIEPDPLYRITYKSEWDKTAKSVTTTKKEVVLHNLVPYTMYTIDVEAKSNKSIYWNDKLTRKGRTLPSAPYAGPQSTNGSFLETTCANKSQRCFILYWTMIPLSLRNGILDGFVIKQDGKILNHTSGSYVEINNQPENKDLWFEIQAKMINSLYSPPTVIRIPSQGPKKLKDLTAVQLNSTHFNISWSLQQRLKNPTVNVMSCLGDNPGFNLWCYSNVKWTKVTNQNFTILKVVNATHFAASVSDLEGSSSLTVAECVLSHGIAQTPQQVIIHKKYPTQVNFQWPPYKCKNLNGKPILFQVLYAERNNCISGSEVNITAIGTKPEREKIEIKNLKPFTNYSICLRIRTVQGWSKMSSQVITLTAETNPSDRVTNLQVVDSDNSSVTLKWDPILQPNGIITHHYVYYQRSGGMPHQTSTDASNTKIMLGLQPLSVYTFSVSACNTVGCSNKSAEVSAALEGSPYVLDLQLFPTSERKLEIKWELPVFLQKHFRYYMLEVLYDNKVFRHYNETKKLHNTTILCDSYNDILVTVNVTVVIKYNNSFIYGSTVKTFPNMCQKSESNLVLYILLGLLCPLFIIFCCGYCLYKQYKAADIVLIHPNVPADSSSSDDNDLKNPHYYMEVDLGSQTNLMDCKSVHLSSTDGEEEEEKNTEITILENDDDSKASVPMTYFGRKEFSTNKEKNEQNLCGKVSPSNFDPNSYIDADIKGSNSIGLELSDLGSNSDPRSRANNSMDSYKVWESNVDSKHYLHHDLSNTSRSSSDSNSLTCNDIALSDLSQTDSKTNDYVQTNMMMSGLKPTNFDSNGYVQNNMDSFSSSQPDSQSDGYVENSTKSCDSNETDLQSDGYVQNTTKSCGSNQADCETNSFVQKNMASADLSQVDSDSNGYISDLSQSVSDSNNDDQNNMKPSLSQADSNGYIKNTTPFDLSQVRADSNESIQNMNISDSSLSDSDSSGFDQNNIKPSLSPADSNGYIKNSTPFDLSQVRADSNESIQNINISDSSLSDSDSSGFDQNNIKPSLSPADSNGYIKNSTPFDLSQVRADSNESIQNMNISDSSLSGSDSSRFNHINIKPSLSPADSNGYIKNSTPFDLSQDSDSNKYVHNINTSDSSLSNSDSNKHRHNKSIFSSKLTPTQSDSDGYQLVSFQIV